MVESRQTFEKNLRYSFLDKRSDEPEMNRNEKLFCNGEFLTYITTHLNIQEVKEKKKDMINMHRTTSALKTELKLLKWV